MSRDGATDGRLDAVEESALTRAWRPRFRTLVFLGALAALGALYAYDLVVLAANDPLVDVWPWPFEPWDPTRLDWLFAVSLVVFGYLAVAPLLARPERARARWERLREDTLATVAGGYVAAFFLVGLLGPLLSQPTLDVAASYQPPAFTSVDSSVTANCLGPVVEGACHGTLRYPFGTTFGGKGILAYTVAGTRVALEVALVAAVFIVPLATVVGTVSAYAGGRVDDVLMRVVDVVQTVPPLFAYIVVRFVLGGGGDLVLLVAVFGLLSWGNVARVVRSEALAQREQLFVTAAESAGGGPLYVVRTHLVPNVSSTVLTATTLQVPTLVLTEAALSYLELGAPHTTSWGTIIAEGTRGTQFGQFVDTWWISVFPVAALTLTVVALSVFGDALRDVLDPRFS